MYGIKKIINGNGIFYYQYTTHLAILLMRIAYYFFIINNLGAYKSKYRYPYASIQYHTYINLSA